MHDCTEKNKIDKILDRITDLEKSRERSNTLIKTFVDTTKELSSTMKQVEKTMVKMNCSLEGNEKQIDSLTKKVDELRKSDEKNKIDMRDLWKNSIMKIGVGGVGLYGVYEIVSNIIEKH